MSPEHFLLHTQDNLSAAQPISTFMERYKTQMMSPLPLLSTNGEQKIYPALTGVFSKREKVLAKWLHEKGPKEGENAFALGVFTEIVTKDMLENMLGADESIQILFAPLAFDETTSYNKGADLLIVEPFSENDTVIPLVFIDPSLSKPTSSRGKIKIRKAKRVNEELATPVIPLLLGDITCTISETQTLSFRNYLDTVVYSAVRNGTYYPFSGLSIEGSKKLGEDLMRELNTSLIRSLHGIIPHHNVSEKIVDLAITRIKTLYSIIQNNRSNFYY